MAAPNWQARVDAAHTLLRETVEPTRFEFDPGQFTDMATPTKLLTGSESPAYYKKVTWAVHDMLPHSRISVIQGHGHVAMNSAPVLFINKVLALVFDMEE